MFSKSNVVAAFLAASSIAAASPTQYGPLVVNNFTPAKITYALVGQSGTVMSGEFGVDTSSNLPLPPQGQGYSLKLATNGQPQSASNILQLEYTLNADNLVSFDWSALNGPDPLVKYNRTLTPSAQTTGNCQIIRCNAGQSNTKCEKSSAGPGPVSVCPSTPKGTVALTVEFS